MTGKEEVPESGKEFSQLPEDWRDFDFPTLFASGWKPRIKKKGGKQYITLRNNNQERSLGPFDSQRWNLLVSFVPNKELEPLKQDADAGLPKKAPKILTTTLARHRAIPPSIALDTDILQYYEWFLGKGYDKPLDVWIHESLRNYFAQNGLGIGIIIRTEVPS